MARWRESIAGLGRGLSDVFFPPVCVHCRRIVEESPFRHLCAACARSIETIGWRCCATCGHPSDDAIEGEGCSRCTGLDAVFSRNRAAALFRGGPRSMVLELKYHGALHVVGDIERVFKRCPSILTVARESILVPVPLHPRKRRERGYNQSEWVARALVRAAGGGRISCLLRRILDTPSQTGFDRRTRQENLKNAFALAPGSDLNPHLRYLLVDDVFTTGSTLNHCASVLLRAGCLSIEAATFAHG